MGFTALAQLLKVGNLPGIRKRWVERAVRTLRETWCCKIEFKSRVCRKQGLIRFVNYYNTVKPHKG